MFAFVAMPIGVVSAATPPPAATSLPMTAATVKAAGLALRYPSSWTVLSYTGLSKAQKKAVAKANPKLSVQAQLGADSANVKNTKFYAQDLVAEQAGQYASGLGVEIVGQTSCRPA